MPPSTVTVCSFGRHEQSLHSEPRPSFSECEVNIALKISWIFGTEGLVLLGFDDRRDIA
jgi:hypothetical protein